MAKPKKSEDEMQFVEAAISPVKTGRAADGLARVAIDERRSKGGFLKVGDIIFLKSQVEIKRPEGEKDPYQVFLSSDGILSTSVESIPKIADNVLVKGANIMTRRCLFRIENARSTQRKEGTDDFENSLVSGKPFTYGEHIQLRHYHSRGLLEIRSREPAQEQGCLQVSIAHGSSDFTWFEVMPVNKLRQQGERIKYSDSIYLRAVGLRNNAYIHIYASSALSRIDKLEVNCSPEQWEWKPRRYMDFDEMEGKGNFVTTSNSFRIYHRVAEGYLVAPEVPLIGVDVQKELHVYVQQGNKTSSSLWELQRSAVFRGGKARWRDVFRIKHLATGFFLSSSGELLSDSIGLADISLIQFVLHPDGEESNEFASFGSLIRLQSVATYMYILVAGEEMDAEQKLREKGEQKQYQIKWTSGTRKSDIPYMAFVIEDISEALTDHIYKLGLMTPVITDFYQVVQSLRTLKKSRKVELEEQSPGEFHEPENTRKMRGDVRYLVDWCENMDQVLHNILKHIILTTDGTVDISKRQDSMREMGVTSAFMELARAIDANCQALITNLGPGDEKCRHLLPKFYSVEKSLLRVVYEAIKANEKSSHTIRDYESYLLAKIAVPGAGLLLREVFRFVQADESMEERDFDRWFKRPDQEEAKLTTEEMILCMQIVGSLCESMGRGIVKFQHLTQRKLLEAQNEFPLVKFGMNAGRPFIELVFRSPQHAASFLSHPEPLVSLQLTGRGDFCYLLEDFCKGQNYTNFLTAALMLFATVCLGRNLQMINAITRELTLSSEHAEAVMQNLRVPETVRAAYARLYLGVFIDVPPFMSISENSSYCYSLDEGVLMKMRVCDGPECAFPTLGTILRRFWDFQGLILLDGEYYEDKLELTANFLRLTKAVVELDVDIGEDKHRFAEDLLQPLSLLLVERVPTSQTELLKHWCCKLMLEVRNKRNTDFSVSLENKWGKVVFEVLLVLEVVLKMRQELHISHLLNKFREVSREYTEVVPWHENFSAIQVDISSILQRLNFDIKFRSQSKETSREYGRMNSHDTEILEKESSGGTATPEEESGVLGLDLHLLQLVFNVEKSRKKKIRNKALDIIIQNMNEKKMLKELLNDVQFLVGPQMMTQFRKLLDLRGRMGASVSILSESKWQSLEHCDPTREERALADLHSALTEVERMLSLPEECTYQLTKLQDLMRLTGLHKELIRILYLKNDEAKYETVLESTFGALRLFTYRHKKNQSMVFEHKTRLLELMEYQEGEVTHLLTEVLSSYRNTDFGREVISYLFQLIRSHAAYPYRVLQLLRTFTRDEAGAYIKNIQTDILKGIVSCGKIVALHTTSVGVLNYTQPQFAKEDSPQVVALKLRFHQEVLRTLIACTYGNRFGLLQCRYLISVTVLSKAIKNPESDFISRKIYIRYLYQVHMTPFDLEIQPVITINDIDFVLKGILKDLKLCQEGFPILLRIAATGVYDNIRMQSADQRSGRTSVLSHAPSFQMPEGEEKKNLDFWNYISGKETIHTEKDGVLHILRDLFSTHTGDLSREVETTKSEIAVELTKLEVGLRQEESTNRELDFSNLILIVNACREALPRPIRTAGSAATTEDRVDSEEGEEMAKLVTVIRDYVLHKNMTLEQAFALFDVDRDGNISVAELKSVLRTLLHGGVREVDLDRAVQYLDSDRDGSVQFEEFTLKMKRFYGKKLPRSRSQFREVKASMLPHLKEMLTPEQESDRRYKESLREFNDEFASAFPDIDIQPLVHKINKEFVQPSLRRKDFTIFKEFISKLGVAFNKRLYKIYLIKMMKLLIKPQKEGATPAEVIETREIQVVLCESGVLEMSLQILSDVSDLELVNESIELLIAMLQGGNSFVQEQLLMILKREPDSHLFSYVRRQLRLSRDRIVHRADKLYEKNPEITLAEMIGEDVGDSGVCEVLTKEEEAHSNHLVNLLKVIQLCCENCYADFQHYIRSQNEGNQFNRQMSIALVNEIAQYLINLKEMGKLLRNDFEAAKVVPSCMEALIDLCKGPCLENQRLLGTKKKLYQFLKSAVNIDLRRTFGLASSPSNPTEALFFISSIRLLKALLEGEYDHRVAETMLSVIDFKALAEKAKDIYELFVHQRLRHFMQNRVEGDVVKSRFMKILIGTLTRRTEVISSSDERIIDLGFDICSIILKLRKEFQNEDLRWLNFSDQVPHSTTRLDQSFFLKRIEAFKGRSENVFHDVRAWLQSVWDKLTGYENTIPMMDLAYSFYLSMIGSVEIDKSGELAHCYFRVPTLVTYMSSKLVNMLLMEVNRNSHDEKIKSFFHKTEKYEVAMTHLRVMSRVRLLSAIASKRRFIEDVCFVMVVALNIVMLFTISSADDARSGMSSMGSTAFLTVFATIISILAVSVYILYIIENYPLVIYEKEHQGSIEGAFENKGFSKLRGTVLMKDMAQYNRDTRIGVVLPLWMKWVFILFDKENVYNLAYVLISFAALQNPFFYSILLLDIIRRSDDLMNILRSITENIKQLLLTLLLGVMIVFLFSVAGFLWFGDYFKNQLEEGAPRTMYCHTLLECFASILNLGVRSGGGVGDVLAYPLLDESAYWYRQLYDILFFIVVSIVLLNIIFGIIIDTFAELRDKRKFIETDLSTVCFICGRKLFEFEYKGAGWSEHIQMEHNLYAYLAFIIYLRRKKLQECDGIEKYVKKRIEQNDVTFFPKTTKSLQQREIEVDLEKSTLSSVKKDLEALLSDLPK